MPKELTLEELGKQNQSIVNTLSDEESTSKTSNGLKSISTNDLIKQLEEEHPEETAARKESEKKSAPPIVDAAFKSLDAMIANKKQKADELVEQAKEFAEEQQLEAMAANTDDDTETISLDNLEDDIDSQIDEEDEVEEEKPKKKKKKAKEESIEDMESDIDALDNLLGDLESDDSFDVDDEEEETPEELRERFKAKMDAVIVTNNPIDLSTFKIKSKPVSVSSILNGNTGTTTKKRADWPLLHSERNMTFEECSGPELESLQKTISNSSGINGVVATLKFIYNHTVDANKPSFEVWTKQIKTEDIESLYFGIYLACYNDSNLVARTCEHDGCKKTSLIETNVHDMYKIEDEEWKEKFDTLRIKDTTTETKTIESIPLQISDDFVITYRPATLYSTFIQFATLKPEITEKYSDILNTMAYIDNFYAIDRESHELIPIAIKTYPNNINKTILSKLKVYTEILRSLNTDQYNILNGKLSSLIQESKISYIYPKAECPECNNEMPETEVDSVLNLLFTRAQLARIKSL